jgi:hypothetical protein
MIEVTCTLCEDMVRWPVRLATLRAKHAALVSVFTERSRRLWAATEVRAIGYGGILSRLGRRRG